MHHRSVWAYIKPAPFHALDFTNHLSFANSRMECQGIFGFSIGMACQEHGISGKLSSIHP